MLTDWKCLAGVFLLDIFLTEIHSYWSGPTRMCCKTSTAKRTKSLPVRPPHHPPTPARLTPAVFRSGWAKQVWVSREAWVHSQGKSKHCVQLGSAEFSSVGEHSAASNSQQQRNDLAGGTYDGAHSIFNVTIAVIGSSTG
jgi:hypothetical protein